MEKLEYVNISNIRHNISDYFTEAVYKNKLIEISRHGKERAFMMGDKVLDLILKSEDFSFKIEEIKENDGSITIIYKTLDIVANGETYKKAVEDLVEQAKEYAKDFLEDLDFYIRDEDRKKHLPLIISIAKAKNDEELINILKLQEQYNKTKT